MKDRLFRLYRFLRTNAILVEHSARSDFIFGSYNLTNNKEFGAKPEGSAEYHFEGIPQKELTPAEAKNLEIYLTRYKGERGELPKICEPQPRLRRRRTSPSIAQDLRNELMAEGMR